MGTNRRNRAQLGRTIGCIREARQHPIRDVGGKLIADIHWGTIRQKAVNFAYIHQDHFLLLRSPFNASFYFSLKSRTVFPGYPAGGYLLGYPHGLWLKSR
jgi:hypothetical protein